MKNVYGYIRVSTAKQGEGVSLVVQKEAITRYAVQYNLNIIRWFEEKETAAKQGRPLFNTMMKLLRAKRAHGVIIHKIDRSARNLKDWADLGALIDGGVEVHFAHESLDLQARGGRLSADIQAVIAADYIRNLRQEAIKGLYGRLKQGLFPFRAPIGYLNTGKGKYKEIDLVKGPLVKKAFELYATRAYTLRTLAVRMNQLGLKNLNQSPVTIQNLSDMLNNPFYMGIIQIKDMSFNGGHQHLISPVLYKRVQAVMRGNENQKVVKHHFKFSKFLTCEGCGYSLIAELKKGHVYYRCHTKNCFTKSVRETAIDLYLLRQLEAMQLQPIESEILGTILDESEQDWETTQKELIRSVQWQNAQIKPRLDRLTDCYVEGGLDKDVYEERKLKLLTESKELQVKEQDLLSDRGGVIQRTKKYLELAGSLKNSYKTANPDEQREMAELITSDFKVSGKNLMITMKNPFEEFSERLNFTLGAPNRDTPRKMWCNVDELSSIDKNDTAQANLTTPLNKEQMKSLLDLIIKNAGTTNASNAEACPLSIDSN
jgi:DNA invertase Pin-like site-specific DNA recombinase